MTESFYLKHLLPLVRKAGSKAETPAGFIEWIKSNKERANKYMGIEWDVREFDAGDWDAVLTDASEL